MPVLGIWILPYALQLLCIIHVVRTGRGTSWIWIIIMVPYVGGLAYLALEILPELLSRHQLRGVQDGLAALLRPAGKIEALRQKAEISPTHNNLVEYADALLAGGRAGEALEIYRAQDRGVFQGDAELAYRIALALHEGGREAEAAEALQRLLEPKETRFRVIRDCLLHLAITEASVEPRAAKEEYEAYLALRQDLDLELQFLRFLAKEGFLEDLDRLVEARRREEKALRMNRMKYNRRFYAEAYRIAAGAHRRVKAPRP